jgi:hypothetical protein
MVRKTKAIGKAVVRAHTQDNPQQRSDAPMPQIKRAPTLIEDWLDVLDARTRTNVIAIATANTRGSRRGAPQVEDVGTFRLGRSKRSTGTIQRALLLPRCLTC